jgi:hypothetical protein
MEITPPETVQVLPLPSMIRVAEGIVVPFGDMVLAAAAAFITEPTATWLVDALEPTVPPPLHAAIARNETPSAILNRLIAERMEAPSMCLKRPFSFGPHCVLF